MHKYTLTVFQSVPVNFNLEIFSLILTRILGNDYFFGSFFCPLDGLNTLL